MVLVLYLYNTKNLKSQASVMVQYLGITPSDLRYEDAIHNK